MEHTLLNLVIAVLAAWRITGAINRERIGEYIRKKIAKEKLDAVGLKTYADGFFPYMIMCFGCLSFWVSIFCTICFLFFPLFLYPFAISTLVIFLDKGY